MKCKDDKYNGECNYELKHENMVYVGGVGYGSQEYEWKCEKCGQWQNEIKK